ncbi:hypothetical protein LXM94_07860 [Rhizobium sp. TRM95111]|uniref:hypothetical protein n=1 Tax=Rhizobium alarense TaxID=2846851 RepID=UPI001F35B75C|nr:hypothetical protein [Rhizobium alarense]MCF3639882.1 hypothetical protein [Rhizobium alarense]
MAIIKGDNRNNVLQPNPLSGDSVFKIYGYGGKDQIFGAFAADNFLYGGNGDDIIRGGSFKNTISGGSGNDDIMASDSRDVIIGGGGHDRMYGLDGGDRFVFRSVADIGKGLGNRDVIEDFKLGTFNGADRIDLSQIDAKRGTPKNDKFTFVAEEGADFSGRKGELVWETKPIAGGFNAALVKGDVNGDGKADFILEVTDSMDMLAGDFIL